MHNWKNKRQHQIKLGSRTAMLFYTGLCFGIALHSELKSLQVP